MKATKTTKPAPTTKRIVGVVVLAGMAAVLAYALSGPNDQSTGPSGLAGFVSTASAAEGTTGVQSAGPSSGASAAAMQQAASANKYLFAFLYEKDDDATRAARKAFDAAVKKITPAPQSVALDRTAPAEKEFVAKFGVDRAPMPLVLAIAPNGAVTGGFKAAELTEERLRDAVASAGLQKCVKALQDKRLVLVCLQNGRTKANDAAMKGVNEFKADPQFGAMTDIVKVDPSDTKEMKLLAQLKADPQAKMATTAFLAPPGVLVANIDGPTSKDALKAALQKAMSSCAPGAGSGCCPPKK